MAEGARLAGRAAVITGANQGIGAAVARAFAAQGARLCLADLREDRIGAVVEAARAAGAEAFAERVDVTDPAQVERLMAAAEARLGGIDVLVNCAGVFHAAPILDCTLEDWNRVLAVNATGTLLCCQAALRRMMPRQGGRIVNLSSIAGKRGNRFVTAYSAAKHAVLGITRSIAVEVAAHGITVNAICPGYVNTEMYDGVLTGVGGLSGVDDPERFRAMMVRQVPIGRMIEPEEIAGLAVYLAAPESDGMTGQALALSGGLVQG